ncbi:ATP-binding protein [Ructibacterium gallinarum]|uniref:ATP-binding protein n=1 Tax=Ructibacterium gallinarum TaxID=2779355 RepID=A0A9D5M215_9FIRM|nr:ATP-binding protein [Ructibacterium gallinarum]MBE5039998.1 ATP-binding protein [Ructibacterium gallinarum]
MNLFIFDNLTRDSIIQSLLTFRETGSQEAYYTAARGLISYASHRITKQSIIREYVLRTMLEQDGLPDIVHLRDFLRQDIKTIYTELLDIDWDALFHRQGLVSLDNICTQTLHTGLKSYVLSLQSMIECQSNEALGGAILAHAESFGTGKATAYAALEWDGSGLIGINRPDPIQFEDLTGLQHQKKVLIANTESFLCGQSANDVLLTGSSGTGKSSCVKACLNMFKDRGLRLIELKKSYLNDLPQLFTTIKNNILKYIIFIDDLSFEPDDMSYKLLKSALDGQAEMRGSNVLIYATSNRRSLIKETWSEREGYLSDEVHRNEGLSERKSLASRFGINLSFLTPTQNEYLQIVENMLMSRGIEMTEEIRSKALTWEINYNGFSGRTAKQFVASILSNQ